MATRFYDLEVAGCKRKLSILNVTDKLAIAGFIMLGDVELVDACAKELAKKGIEARVVDMHTIKPLDVDCVKDCIEKIGKIITVEDHNILNGLGSAVCEVVAEEGKGIVRRIGVQDQFGQSAPYERLLAMNGITVEGIVEAAEKLQ